MKKIKIFSLLILALIVSLINSVNVNAVTFEELVPPNVSLGSPFYGNLLTNPYLLYSETDTEIPGWTIVARNSATGTLLEMKMDPVVEGQPYRTLSRKDGQAPTAFHNVKISRSNTGAGVQFGATTTEDNGFYAFRQTVTTPTNTLLNYTLIHDQRDQVGNQTVTRNAIIGPTTDPFTDTVAKVVYAGNELYRSGGNVSTEVGYNSGSRTSATFFIRISANSIGKMLRTNYAYLGPDSERLIHEKLFQLVDSYTNKDKVLTDQQVQTIKSELEAMLANSNNEGLKTYIEDRVTAYDQKRAERQTLINSFDALYTDETKVNLKPEVTSQTIADLAAQVSALDGVFYTDTLSIEVDKANAILALDQKALEYITFVADAMDLTEAQKTSFNDRLVAARQTAKEMVASKTVAADVTTEKELGFTNLFAIYLEAYKLNKSQELDAKVTTLTDRINALTKLTSQEKQGYIDRLNQELESKKTAINTKETTAEIDVLVIEAYENFDTIMKELIKVNDKRLTDDLVNELNPGDKSQELQDIIDQGKTEIDNAQTEEEIENKKQELFEKIRVQVAKESAIKELSDLRDIFNTQVDGYTYLTETEKNDIKEVYDLIYDGRIAQIKLATSTEEVETLLSSAKTLLNNFNVQAKKENSYNYFDQKLHELRDYIEASEYLTEAQKNQYITEAQNKVTQDKDTVSTLTTIAAVESQRVMTTNALDRTLLNAQKDEARKRVDDETAITKNLINENQDLTEEQKNKYLTKIDELKATTLEAINDATTKPVLDQIEASLKADYENQLILASQENETNVETARENYKQAITREEAANASDINGLTSLTASEKQAFLDKLAQIKTDALALLDNQELTTVQELRAIYDEKEALLVSERNAAFLRNNKNEEIAYLTSIKNQIVETKASWDGLTEAQVTSFRQELETILSNAIDAINEATTQAQLQTTKNEYVSMFNQKALSIFKQHALNKMDEKSSSMNAEIDLLTDLSEIQRNQYKQNITTKLNAAKTKLESDTTVSQAQATLDAFRVDADQIYSDARVQNTIEKNAHLNSVKQGITTELENYVGSVRSTTVNSIIADEVAKIIDENHEDTDAINEIIRIAKDRLLAQVKLEAKASLDALVSDKEGTTQEILDFLDDAKAIIDEQTSPEDVKRILDAKTNAIMKMYIKDDVEEAKKELDEAYPKPRSEEVDRLVEEAKKELEDALTKEDIDRIKDEAKQKIDEQIKKENEANKDNNNILIPVIIGTEVLIIFGLLIAIFIFKKRK